MVRQVVQLARQHRLYLHSHSDADAIDRQFKQDNANDSNGDMTVDFGLVPNMSIGSTVFYDYNDDGTQSGASEIGIAGVTLQLLYDANNDGFITGAELVPVATDVTDANGDYYFGNLPAGNYQVVVPSRRRRQ